LRVWRPSMPTIGAIGVIPCLFGAWNHPDVASLKGDHLGAHGPQRYLPPHRTSSGLTAPLLAGFRACAGVCLVARARFVRPIRILCTWWGCLDPLTPPPDAQNPLWNWCEHPRCMHKVHTGICVPPLVPGIQSETGQRSGVMGGATLGRRSAHRVSQAAFSSMVDPTNRQPTDASRARRSPCDNGHD
jgi:hypothetical protein